MGEGAALTPNHHLNSSTGHLLKIEEDKIKDSLRCIDLLCSTKPTILFKVQ